MTTSSPAGWSPVEASADDALERRGTSETATSRRSLPLPTCVASAGGSTRRAGLPTRSTSSPIPTTCCESPPSSPSIGSCSSDCAGDDAYETRARVPEKISSRRDRASSPRPTWRSTALSRRRPGPARPSPRRPGARRPCPAPGCAASAKRSRPDAPIGLRRQHAARHVHRERAVERGRRRCSIIFQPSPGSAMSWPSSHIGSYQLNGT